MSQNWKHQYFENNSKELNSYIFKSLEMEQYLEKTLKDHGFGLQNYQINFLTSSINIILSVCKIPQATIKPKNEQNHITNKKKLIKKVQERATIKAPMKQKYLQTLKICKKYRQNDTIELASLSSKMLKSLKLFTQNKMNLYLTIKEINYVNSKKDAKQSLKTLYKFQKSSFFKTGQKILIPFITQNSAKLLSEYIATQLRIAKKQHNFFFNFLKESLQTLLNQRFSRIEGIKIIIKGRINNSARSQRRILKLGKISLISFKSKVEYAESTSFTSNGTIGVKIWISKKL